MKTPDFVAIGHFTRDLTDGGWELGGGVAYAAWMAAALGRDVAVVTSGDPGDLVGRVPGSLRLIAAPTTTFRNRYAPSGRTQWLTQRAAPITPGDLPPEWRPARIVLLAPVAGELAPEFADGFGAGLVVAAAQGWLRCWDSGGLVRPARWPVDHRLAGVDAVVLSLEDLGGDWDAAREIAAGMPVAVITRGAEGVTLFDHGREHRVPAYPAAERHPTGAGDGFSAAFAIRLEETGSALEAADFACAAAALAVARTSDRFPDRAMIEARRAEGRR